MNAAGEYEKPLLLRLLLRLCPTAAGRLVERGVEGDDDEDGDGDGGPKRADIGAVFEEMAGVLVPRVIKRNAKGDQFRYALGRLNKSVVAGGRAHA